MDRSVYVVIDAMDPDWPTIVGVRSDVDDARSLADARAASDEFCESVVIERWTIDGGLHGEERRRYLRGALWRVSMVCDSETRGDVLAIRRDELRPAERASDE